MIHIYKVYRAAASTLLLTAALTATLTACTDSREPLQQNEPPGEGKFFSVTATQGGGAETRVTHEHNATTQGVDVKWADGDKIYVGKKLNENRPINSRFSELTITSADAGQTTARFEGTIKTAHQPAHGETLYAVYGEKRNIWFRNNTFDYSYTDQRQTDNDDMAHLASYDYMSASTIYDSYADTHHFDFKHAGSLMKFSLDGLGGQKVQKLTLSTLDGTDAFIEGNHSYSSTSLDFGAEDNPGITIANGGKLEAYLMAGATTEPAGKKLILYVTTADGTQYATMLTGAAIAAGKVYTITATLSRYGFTGAGTPGEPYQINSAGDLTRLLLMTYLKMMDTHEKHFKLTKDIDLAGEELWLPIGDYNKPFKGTFTGEKATGGNYSITINLVWDKVKCDEAGLFGVLNGATIKNVTVKGGMKITTEAGRLGIGGIAGSAGNSTIEGCISQCAVQTTDNNGVAGGILGYNLGNVKVINCTNEGNVTGVFSGGGIIGESYSNGTITGCTNSGSITATDNPPGGIIGVLKLGSTNEKFVVTNCKHEGSKPKPHSAGCIIGSYTIKQGVTPFSTITITGSEGNSTTSPIIGNANKEVAGKWPPNDVTN